MMTNFSENVLGILYRRKGKDGEWHGGAMYYLKDGLGGKKRSQLLSVFDDAIDALQRRYFGEENE